MRIIGTPIEGAATRHREWAVLLANAARAEVAKLLNVEARERDVAHKKASVDAAQ